jgi:hypothetical protein
MRKVKNITVCVTPEIDRQARPLAAEYEPTTESTKNGFEKTQTKSLFLRTSKNNSFVCNRSFPNSLFMTTLPNNHFVFNSLPEVSQGLTLLESQLYPKKGISRGVTNCSTRPENCSPFPVP